MVKILLPAAYEAAHLIDIQVQGARMPIREHAGQSHLSNAGWTVQQNQICHRFPWLSAGLEDLGVVVMPVTLSGALDLFGDRRG